MGQHCKGLSINIFFSEKDGEYIVDIPDLKSCTASGATPEEALGEVLIAKDLWLEVAREEELPIPEPRYRPAINLARQFTWN